MSEFTQDDKWYKCCTSPDLYGLWERQTRQYCRHCERRFITWDIYVYDCVHCETKKNVARYVDLVKNVAIKMVKCTGCSKHAACFKKWDMWMYDCVYCKTYSNVTKYENIVNIVKNMDECGKNVQMVKCTGCFKNVKCVKKYKFKQFKCGVNVH